MLQLLDGGQSVDAGVSGVNSLASLEGLHQELGVGIDLAQISNVGVVLGEVDVLCVDSAGSGLNADDNAVTVVTDNTEELKKAILEVYDTIRVYDAAGENMIVSLFDPENL